MKPYVITIARQYGSGGKTVGKMLARKLCIPFYNREIITMASEDSGVNAMLFSDERLKGDFLTRLRAHYHGNAPVPNDSSKSYLKDEALFAYQVKIIRRLADQGPCVMIGRCADYILAGRPDVVRVFVHADKDFCLEQAMKVDSLPATTGMMRGIMICRSTAACSALTARLKRSSSIWKCASSFRSKQGRTVCESRRFSFLRLAVERGCTGLIILKGFTVGCAKMNCGNAAREGALGYDSAHRM